MEIIELNQQLSLIDNNQLLLGFFNNKDISVFDSVDIYYQLYKIAFTMGNGERLMIVNGVTMSKARGVSIGPANGQIPLRSQLIQSRFLV